MKEKCKLLGAFVAGAIVLSIFNSYSNNSKTPGLQEGISNQIDVPTKAPISPMPTIKEATPTFEPIVTPFIQITRTQTQINRTAPTLAPVVDLSSEKLSCQGKTKCRQMVSCDEAKFYLNQCGVNRLDGDNDGIPCETICGN